MKTLTASILGLGTVLLCAKSWAQAVTVEDEAPAVEVSAFRIPVLESEAVQGVTVITQRAIQARNATSAAEVLQMVPGLHVDRMGGAGGATSVYIRGNDLEHTLVLIDGVRMNDPLLSRPGYDLSALDPNAIERIEVIRGAGSALYGADAIGGVINIVTRRDANVPLKATVGAGLGSKGFGNASARLAGSTESIKYSAGAAKLKDGKDSEGGEIDLTTFDGNLAWQSGGGVEVRLSGRLNQRESTSFPEDSGGVRLARVRTLEKRDAEEATLGAALTYTVNADLRLDAQLSRYSREEDIDAPNIPHVSGFFDIVPATRSTTELTRDTLLASAGIKLPLQSDLTAGYELQKEDGDSRSTLAGLPPDDFQRDRDTNSVFVSLKSKPAEDFVFMLDVRHDRVSGLGSETSPGVGVRFQRGSTALKARYSEGFRPPSFYALSSPLVGNVALRPETSKSAELGAEQQLGSSIALGLNLFKTRTRNLIDFVSGGIGPLGIGEMRNRDTVDAKGFEFYANAQPARSFDVGFHYTRVQTDIKDSTDELKNRPKHRASLSAHYLPDEMSRVSLHIVYVGKSLDETFANTAQTRVESYTRTDIGYTLRLGTFSLSAAVDNLFDKRYEEFIGFTNPGRRYRLGISATF